MPKVKTTYPNVDRNKGQRSLDLPLYLDRIVPWFNTPTWYEGGIWRKIVEAQPIATTCRETLISNISTLDWKIEPKDSEKRDEYKEEIDYYEDFFDHTAEFDFVELIEWIVKDYLDIPFGGAIEIGRQGDSPDGKIMWIEPLDGATLWPTQNSEWPVAQTLLQLANKTVYFPYYAINRLYMSPRTEIMMKGWGFTPPQKIYLALEMMNRGDNYYGSLLLDTPEAGILDLGDMEKSSAAEWVQSWREMLKGIDPFKIPVLYEHNNEVKFIPFQRSPTEIMYGDAITRYASLMAAGYGMTLSDIGFQSPSNGGNTLAGTIRNERISRRSGFGRARKKVKSFFDKMLPDDLFFKWIDLDDETSVAMGRARLASATALSLMIDKGSLTADEVRQQMIADGLITISIPEKMPEAAKAELQANKPAPFGNPTAERPAMLGKPVAPSQGGYGEIKAEIIDYALKNDTVFRDAYDSLDAMFEGMSIDDQRYAVTIMQTYLHKYAEINGLLDGLEVIDDNIIDEEQRYGEAEAWQTAEISTAGND